MQSGPEYVVNNPEALVEDLRRFTGGKAWMSKRMVRTWMGIGDNKLASFLQGTRCRINGNRIEYFIGDIAQKAANELVEG